MRQSRCPKINLIPHVVMDPSNSRKSWWWLEWSSRLFFTTWPGVFALTCAFLMWVANSIFAHDKRISELERAAPGDHERLRLQVMNDFDGKMTPRLSDIMVEIKSIQRAMSDLRVNQEVQKALSENGRKQAQ